jgi:hypothetical protein
MAVAALVLGIVSLVFVIIPGLQFIGAIVGVVGIVLGALARKKLKADNMPTSTATAGLVMSIIGAALSAIMYIACVACMATAAKGLEEAAKDPKFLENMEKLNKELKDSN